jgi:hypothetical protein
MTITKTKFKRGRRPRLFCQKERGGFFKRWAMTMGKVALVGSVALLLAGISWSQEAKTPAKEAPTPQALKAEIEALKAAKVAWREIAWKSCLLEGLKESRAKNKPVLLWVFIDRPTDDARC